MAILKNTAFSDTTVSLTPPSGTTAQRPAAPEEGAMRYNSTLGITEIFFANTWMDINGGLGNTLMYVPLYGNTASNEDITDVITGTTGNIGNTVTRNYTQSGTVGTYCQGGGHVNIPMTDRLTFLNGNPFWTVEFWAWNFNTSPTGNASTMLEMNNYPYGILYRASGSGADHYFRGSSVAWGNFVTGQWCHYALVGLGSTIRHYQNGIQSADTAPGSDSRFGNPYFQGSASGLRISASNHTAPTGQYANAVYRKFRVSSIVRYTSNFTPSAVYPL